MTPLANSLLLGVATAVFATVGGFFAALVLAAAQRGRMLLFAASVGCFVLPPFLVVNAWLEWFGTVAPLKDWFNLFSLHGTVLLLTLGYWPIAAILIAGAWSRLDRQWWEVTPEISPMQLFRAVLWPGARREAVTAAAIIFVLAVAQFSLPAILQVKVVPFEVWLRFSTDFNIPAALTAGWPLILPAALLVLWKRPAVIAWNRESGRQLVPGLKLGWLGRFAACVTFLLIALGFVFPVFDLVISRRSWTELPGAAAASAGAVGYSLLTATLAASFGLVCAWGLRKQPFGRFGWLGFLMPGVVFGIAAIGLFNRPAFAWLHPSLCLVTIALLWRLAGPAWELARQAWYSLDQELRDTARLSGATGIARELRTHGAQLLWPLGAAWYTLFILALWEVDVVLLLQPPGVETLPVRIFNLLHYGHAAQVNALCLILLGVAAAPALVGTVAYALWKRRGVASLLAAVVLLSGCSQAEKPAGASPSQIFDRFEVIGRLGTGPGQFNKPRSVAVDREDNIYVVDMTGRVQKFSPEGKYLLAWEMPQTDKGRPKGMSLDHDGNVLLVEPHYSRVNHFDTLGHLVRQWGKNGTNAGEVMFPRSIAVNKAGEIWVSEYGAVERVQRFSPDGLKLLGSVGKPGNGPGDLNRAEGVGMDGEDRLFVADSCNHRIQVFGPTGEFVSEFGRAGRGVGELSYPYDVRVDKTGRRYVCEFGNSRIQVFDPQNKPVELIGRPGSGIWQLATPWSIALDSRGNLYIADSGNNRVVKLVAKANQASGEARTTR